MEPDVLARISDPHASDRKLEKELRRRALGLRLEERARAVEAVDPELVVERVEDGWAARVTLTRYLRFELAGETLDLPAVATLHGVPLELRLLTSSPEHVARVARRVLETALRREEARMRDALARVEAFIAERRARPFYDVTGLLRLVRRELADTDGLPALPKRIAKAARRLDLLAEERERVRRVIHDQGLVVYRDLFPLARTLERRLTFFCGPTNSGKTWRALNRLVEAGSGAYLAPLRLLALEGQEELEARGVIASFITGEERDIREGARFVASTIEMLNPDAAYEAVVIDEIQMLADPDRGWAWCQALVGAAAPHVILTGSPDAIPLVEAMAEYLEEPLEVVRLERHTPLVALPNPVPLQRVRPGTAVVAFSRREILRLKEELERRFKVAVVYGNLTPEVRREEARRFRSGEAQVLVSTDAIAMGLNLPIETVLFAATEKYDGVSVRPLTAQELLQIGGRAGRYGHYEVGHVGTLHGGNIARVQEVFEPGFAPEPLPLETRVRPAGDHVDALAAGLETHSLVRVLSAFRRSMHFDTRLFGPGVTDDMETLARWVDRYPEIPLDRRLMLSCAPVDTGNDFLLRTYGEWVGAVAEDTPVRLGRLPGYVGDVARDDTQLQGAESEAKRLTVYAWLAYRDAHTFPDLELCQAQRIELDAFIERSLARRAATAPQRGERRGRRRPGSRRR